MRSFTVAAVLALGGPGLLSGQASAGDTVYIAEFDTDSVTVVVSVREGITPSVVELRATPGLTGPLACEGIPAGTETPTRHRCARVFVEQPVYVRLESRPLGKITIPPQTQAASPTRAPESVGETTRGAARPADNRSTAAAPTGDPELPRAEPALPGDYARQVRVPSGGDLQRALNAARAGDEILLEPGGRYEGPFDLRDRGDDGWVRVATDIVAPPATRIDTTTTLATLTAARGNWTVAALDGADGWELSLLEITHDADHVNAPVYLHGGERIPDRILIDRVWIHPRANGTATRAILGNASNLTIRYSALTEIVRRGQQTQGVAQWNSGVTLIHDNLIMAASQSYLCGGAGGVWHHPSDVTLRRNHMLSRPEWQGRYSSLAHVETKDCHRLLVEANVIDGGDFGLLLKSSAQGGACGQGCGAEHLTIRDNVIRNTRGGANLARVTAEGRGDPMHDVLFDNNLFENIGPDSEGWLRGEGRLFQVLNAPPNLTVRNTTFDTAGHSWLYIVTGPPMPSEGLTIDNVVASGRLRFPVLVQAPATLAAHYRTRNLGTSYGACSRQLPGLTCISSAASWAGADRQSIEEATRGVVR